MTKTGELLRDRDGYIRLYAVELDEHGQGEGVEVEEYRPTNALLPAIARARALGYEDVHGEW